MEAHNYPAFAGANNTGLGGTGGSGIIVEEYHHS